MAVLWNVQAHLLGYVILEVRWLDMIHIPLAFFILGLSAYLTVKAYGTVREDPSKR